MPVIDQHALPATIRRAASVVVTRPHADGRGSNEVFMLVRSAQSTFMPSTLVFPGGRLDPEDGDPSDDAAWLGAARRECSEEAGLEVEGSLRWFDTWLTPSAEVGPSGRRYLARFFLAELPAGAGTEAKADGVETRDGRWATAEEHLAAWDRQEVDLPPPTLCILLSMRDGLPGSASDDPAPAILPKYAPQDGRHFIVMPHDPDYPDLPGETLPAPPRCERLPRRFVREGRIWRPC